MAGDGGEGSGGAVYFLGGSNEFRDGFVRRNEAIGSGMTGGLGGGIYFDGSDGTAAVRGTELVGNRAWDGGAIAVTGTLPRAFTMVAIESNTIMGNEPTRSDTTGAGGIHITASEFIGEIVNNIIAHQVSGHAISCVGVFASPNIRYNCVYNHDVDNVDEEYGGDCTDRTGINGNLKSNPLFCCGFDLNSCDPTSPSHPDLALSSNSVCLGSGEGGVDMGAHPNAVGCGTISVEETTWGQIKAMYR